MNRTNLKGKSIYELESLMKKLGQPGYRAEQIFRWIYRGKTKFAEMTDLPKELVKKLDEIAYISNLKIYEKHKSKLDDTIKYVFLTEDQNLIEAVKMEYSFGVSTCISSQIGCEMGCVFCASTINGFVRNLTCAEMLDQIIAIEQDIGKKVDRVVVMGMGEPLLNYEELIKFLKLINSPKGLNIGFRKITVSTCGIVPQIHKLADQKIPITLAVSLHAPEDDLRSHLMPINNKYPIMQLLDTCRYYIMKTNRRITFEYALIDGVNDTSYHAQKLAELLQGILCHVNLIPLNPVDGKQMYRSNKTKINYFKNILHKEGISVTIRREMGSDINAACGQLRRSLLMR